MVTEFMPIPHFLYPSETRLMEPSTQYCPQGAHSRNLVDSSFLSSSLPSLLSPSTTLPLFPRLSTVFACVFKLSHHVVRQAATHYVEADIVLEISLFSTQVLRF